MTLRQPLFGLALFTLLTLTTPAAGQISVHTDFPGGSGVVSELDQQTRRIRLDPTDYPERGWRCWWYIRLEGLSAGEEVTLDVGEAPWATPDRATYSVDGGATWQHTEPGTRAGKRIVYRLRPEGATLLVAWGPPFVPSDAADLTRRLPEASPDASEFRLCTTREGRKTPALRIAAPGDVSPQDRPLVWAQARQHAWESGSSWVAKGFAEWALSPAPAAKRLRQECELVVVPIMDIDNVARGAGGKAQSPQDHNRAWSDEPHWHAVRAAQAELRRAAEHGRLAVFLDLHNPGAGDPAPYFYIPPRDILSEVGRENLFTFLELAEAEMTAPLRFRGRTIESGRSYDPKAWQKISKNWVAALGTPAVSVTLETAWNTPESTIASDESVGRKLAQTVARYLDGPTRRRAAE